MIPPDTADKFAVPGRAHVRRLLAQYGFDVPVRDIQKLISAAVSRGTDGKSANAMAKVNACAAIADMHPPLSDAKRVRVTQGENAVDTPKKGSYGARVVAIGHRAAVDTGFDTVRPWGMRGTVFYDIKGIHGKEGSDPRL